MQIKQLFFIQVLLFLALNISADMNKYSVSFFKLEGKRGVDSSLVNLLSTSIYNEIKSRESVIVVDSAVISELPQNDSEKNSDYILKGFIGCIRDDFFLLHLKLTNVSSGENVSTVNLEFSGTVEELEGIVIAKAIDKILKKSDNNKNQVIGKLNLSYNDNSRKKRNQIIRRVISGVATVGFSVAGIITNSKLQDLESEYDNTKNGSQAYYNRLWDDIELHNKRRNAFIGAASGSGIVFMVSIPF